MPEHTPGPWKVIHDSDVLDSDYGPVVEWPWQIRAPGPVVICEFLDTSEADARLIAAAPDLLQVCEALLTDHQEALKWGEFGIPYYLEEQVKQAVAKAKGESHG